MSKQAAIACIFNVLCVCIFEEQCIYTFCDTFAPKIKAANNYYLCNAFVNIYVTCSSRKA